MNRQADNCVNATNVSAGDTKEYVDKARHCTAGSAITLETLNSHCLWHIFQYLDMYATVNLALTCPTMRSFAMNYILPKKAKTLIINILVRDNNYNKLHPDIYKCKEPQWLVTFLSNFGSFIKRLIVEYAPKSNTELEVEVYTLVKLIKMCTNLESLHLKKCDFHLTRIWVLKEVTSLSELELINCSSIKYINFEEIKSLATIRRLALTGNDELPSNIFMHFRNLVHLSIGNTTDYAVKSSDLMTIFDLNGHCMESLTLDGFSISPEYQAIRPMITDKLPKLQRLAIVDNLSASLVSFVNELENIQAIEIKDIDANENSLLRVLSKLGSIEEIKLVNCKIDDADTNTVLSFCRLQSFEWMMDNNVKHDIDIGARNIMKILTKAVMPNISSISIWDIVKDTQIEFLALLDSKKSLKIMQIHPSFLYNHFSLVFEVIQILHNSRYDRPHLTLYMQRSYSKEYLDLANANQHLIKVLDCLEPDTYTYYWQDKKVKYRSFTSDFHDEDDDYDDKDDDYDDEDYHRVY